MFLVFASWQFNKNPYKKTITGIYTTKHKVFLNLLKNFMFDLLDLIEYGLLNVYSV